MRPALPRRTRGLTLIELVVALALFSVLGLLTWRATAQMIDTRERVAGELARWREIVRAVQRIELELLQIAAPAVPAGSDAPPALQLLRSADGRSSELRLLAVDAGAAGARRTGFRFRDGRLDWLLWPDRKGAGAVETYPLLEHVTAVRWRFVDEGTRSEDWPRAGQAADALPAAIELELELPDAGTFTRLFAPR